MGVSADSLRRGGEAQSQGWQEQTSEGGRRMNMGWVSVLTACRVDAQGAG